MSETTHGETLPFELSLGKVQRISEHSILHITGGQGTIEVDFKRYSFSANTVLFLAPGQFFRLIAGHLIVRLYELSPSTVQDIPDSRFLFKHIVGVGHLHPGNSAQFQMKPLLRPELAPQEDATLLSTAIADWIRLNPFQVSEYETKVLFDLKEAVDDSFRGKIPTAAFSQRVGLKPYRIKDLLRTKLRSTFHSLSTARILLEAQRNVAFTDRSTKEMAYELGFRDAAYFNRFFRMHTDGTPTQFRKRYSNGQESEFLKRLTQLVNTHFRTEHFAGFYASELCVSERTLERKLSAQHQPSVGRMVRDRLLVEARTSLIRGLSVGALAYDLGFSEAEHFSSFFKANMGMTPTRFVATMHSSHGELEA